MLALSWRTSCPCFFEPPPPTMNLGPLSTLHPPRPHRRLQREGPWTWMCLGPQVRLPGRWKTRVTGLPNSHLGAPSKAHTSRHSPAWPPNSCGFITWVRLSQLDDHFLTQVSPQQRQRLFQHTAGKGCAPHSSPCRPGPAMLSRGHPGERHCDHAELSHSTAKNPNSNCKADPWSQARWSTPGKITPGLLFWGISWDTVGPQPGPGCPSTLPSKGKV